MKESIQYQRSRIENEDGDLDRAKDAANQYFKKNGDTYGPGCCWLLVSPGAIFISLQCQS